jgi:MscS family membrane protein
MALTASARIFFAALLLGLCAAGAQAQTVPGATPPAENGAAPAAKPEQDPFGRETPQGMVGGLMNALAAADYERAVRFFEIETVQDERLWYALSGPTLARRFQAVLDRAGTVTTPAELSNDGSGNVNDGLAQDSERFGQIKTPQREVPLLAKRITREGKALWLVSAETLNRIPALARDVTGRAAVARWIELLPEGPAIGGVPSSHWLALLLAAVGSFGLAWMLTGLRKPLARLIRRGGPETRLSRFIEASAGPLRVMITLLLFGIVVETLGVSVVARYRVLFIAQLIGWFAAAWLFWRWADAAAELVLGRMSRLGQLTAYSSISFLSRAFKALLVILFIAAMLRAFGINVTAGLAALGVGGLAIALGAQKLFENLIGSLTLLADRPVRIGDFCRFGNTLGTVEEIGIRSTRIRTLDRTVLTVPNGEFSTLHIENYSQRDRYWFHPVLNLRYETSTDQMRHLLALLREKLAKHPKLDAESLRVRLIGLAANALDVEIFAYVTAWDYSNFLETQEELLFTCMEAVEEAGTGFAFPSQTLYLGRDSGLNAERTRAAEEAARKLREQRA